MNERNLADTSSYKISRFEYLFLLIRVSLSPITMSTSFLAFVCGLLAATSISLAIFTLLSRGRESAIHNPEGLNGRPRPAQAMDVGPVQSSGPQGAPPPYAPAPPPPSIYVIAPQSTPMPVQPYFTQPPPQMRPPPFPAPPFAPPPLANPPPPVTTSVPPLVRLNDLQILVHQQQNIFTERWEEYSPCEFPTTDIAFLVFARRQRHSFVPSTLFLLEIYSESLKRVLKGCDCLKYVESVFDPRPQVLQYSEFQS